MKSAEADAFSAQSATHSTGGLLSQPALALVAAILLLTTVRAVVAASTELTDDEAYYRLWSLAPSMSYFDHPPMVGWMIAVGRWTAGDSALGVRLAALAASLAGPFVLWRTAYLLFGSHTARRAVWVALAMPLLAVGGVIITPDTPSVLFWGLSAWAIAELNASGNANWWMAAGTFAGLGLLSKYTNLFVGASILLWLLLVPANRRWFATWQLWAGGSIACALALPVLIWNAQHDWISFGKQFGRVVQGSHVTLIYFAEMGGAFAGLASPLIAGLAAIGLCGIVRSTVVSRDQASTLIAAGLLPLLAYFAIHALHGRVQPNWMAPIYPSLAVCAALALDRIEQQRERTFGRLGLVAIGVGGMLSGLAYLHAASPLVHIAGHKDPTGQMRGWEELAGEVRQLRASTGACWIATSSYATTGQLAYRLKGEVPVVQLDERQRYIHLPAPDAATLTCPALHIELERRTAYRLLQSRFDLISFVTTVERKHGDAVVARYAVYRVAGPRPELLDALTQSGR